MNPKALLLRWWPWHRVDAGKVELDGAQYLGFRLPFTISQLCWIEAILVGGAEIYRNGELDSEKRIYPGDQPWLCMFALQIESMGSAAR